MQHNPFTTEEGLKPTSSRLGGPIGNPRRKGYQMTRINNQITVELDHFHATKGRHHDLTLARRTQEKEALSGEERLHALPLGV